MAVHETNGCQQLLVRTLELTGKPLSQLAIAEMGNQRLKPSDNHRLIHRLHPLKALLTFLGAKHVSFDRNGKNQALPYDLSRRLPQEYLSAFDVVTNFGTLEHVGVSWRRHRIAWRNFHSICKTGGLLTICGPHIEQTAKHGMWHYNEEWLRWIAAAHKWEELHMEALDTSVYWPRRPKGYTILLLAIFRKTEDISFVGPRKWISPPRSSVCGAPWHINDTTKA